MKVACRRRSLVSLVLIIALAGLGSACGVKGPLYQPQDAETEKEKKKPADKTSQQRSVPPNATHG